MGWAEQRMREYQAGKPATWLERRMLEHANPLHFTLALVAGAGLAFGLWTHEYVVLLGAALLALSGRIYCWTLSPRSAALAEVRRSRSGRHTESVDHRGGTMVRALSQYGSSKRVRRLAGTGDDQGKREAS
jgi:hypothetical protein